MAITGKKLTNLTEATSLADNDLMLLESSSVSKKIKWSTVYNAIKSKLVSWLNSLTFSVTTTSKTLPGAINELDKDVGAINSSLTDTKITRLSVRSAGSLIVDPNYTGWISLYKIKSEDASHLHVAVVTTGDWAAGNISYQSPVIKDGQIQVQVRPEAAGNTRVNYIVFYLDSNDA